MHVMSGNMSKAGITKDLEAMAEAGIGGIILFNVTHYVPKGKTIFNSPEHIEMTAFAAAECERLGLSFGVHNCDGWTSSGGPWVTPEHSMKQVVYSQKIVEGGKVKTRLEKPSSLAGFYKEIAVLDYPTLQPEMMDDSNTLTLKSSDKNLDLNILNDGKIDKKTLLKVSNNASEWIEFQYKKPFTLNSIYINFHTRVSGDTKFLLKVSDDGINYKTVNPLNHQRMGKIEHGVDMVFDSITSKYFRIESPVSLNLSEISLSAVKRFNNMLARTSLFKIENMVMPNMDEPNPTHVINKSDIINITESIDEDGNLAVTLPKGDWTIMRFGYTIMGAVNSPASDEGTGWEVDKMSRESFKTFYEGYVRNVIDASKKIAPNALQYIEIDSYEVGGQNWTKDYESYFTEALGYNIIDFLPLYAGRYINDTKTTEQVLWDVRNFNSKLMTDNYFDYFTELCHQDGLISYVEPYSFNAGFNELDAARKVDITMGEFWMHQRYQAGTAVSGARIYGKNIVSAEAFSALPEINWKGHPGSLKLTGDKAWTLGINEFMFHRFAHQANTYVKPGMTMSQWGSHMDRTQTWWYNAGKSWFKYLARGQYLLRQGNPVSDLLVFVGDGSPNSIVKEHMFNPSLPKQINFDCINADALINRIRVEDSKLVLPNGISYKALHLNNIKEIKLSTLRKIAELANQGIVIIAEKPNKLGGYNVSEADTKEFRSLVNIVWNKPTTYEQGDWLEIFKSHQIPTDLYIENGEDINYIHRKTENEDIYFFYNPVNEARSYTCTFNISGKIPELWNQMTGEITKLATFIEEDGKTKALIELPAEGSIFVVFSESSSGVVSVNPESFKTQSNVKSYLSNKNQLYFEVAKSGDYNLVLSDGKSIDISEKNLPADIDISENWKVYFPDIISGKKEYDFTKLIDWTTHKDEGVKYYSGTATYSKEIDIKKSQLNKNIKTTLHLGEVHIAGKVIVNGMEVGTIWVAPYEIDITPYLIIGKNAITIELTNQWTNRLIGDENFPNETEYDGINMPEWYINNEPPPLKQRSTFTTFSFYQKGDDTIPAGLLGPVVLKSTKIIN
jgi:hypothetical protein